MNENQAWQGDLLLEWVSDPLDVERDDLSPLGQTVLALGEESGHSHVLENAQWVLSELGNVDVEETLRRFATGEMGGDALAVNFFVNVPQPTPLRHVDAAGVDTIDHGSLPVRAGVHRVTRQREIDPFANAWRAVVD